MIVNDRKSHWEIIFQRAHALLAAVIAYHLKEEYYPKGINKAELLTAISTHDDGRKGWEGMMHLDSSGYPLNYKDQPINIQIQQAEKCIANADYRSPWIALLIRMHQEFLYKSFARSNKEVSGFLTQQREKQLELIKELKINSNTAEKAYQFMQWCDELSLILCEDRAVAKGTKIGGLGKGNVIINRLDDDSYTVEPWVFNTDKVELTIESYQIEKQVFQGDQHLYNYIKNLKADKTKWVLKR